jgi:L-aspartate oxidase
VKKFLHKRRYLTSFDTDALPKAAADVVVIGSGIAGLRSGIEAARYGKVIVLTKRHASESNTDYAQGGVAAVLSPADSVEDHVRDTLVAGAGLCDEAVVRHVVSEGPALVKELIEWGADFDRDDGRLLFTQEGGHSKARIIHAHGDATGHEIERVALARASAEKNITIVEHAYAVDVLTDNGTAVGVLAYVDGRLQAFYAGAVIIASGGACHVFRETTNPDTATGDGIAIAYRAGATLSDLEFVQFHPTTLYIAGASRTLISETVRGEGGRLIDRFGVHFMPNYHPLGDLAPRDIVSRGIIRQMQATRDTNVYLDLRHLDKDRILKRFPKMAELTALFDIDISKDVIPVRPSAHYFCGGVKTDMNGATDVAGLYACGETASTGLHGANRLGSNSLLEGLVFGWNAGRAAGEAARSGGARPRLASNGPQASRRGATIDLQDMENSLRSLMWRQVGIEREARALTESEERVDFWSSYVMDREFGSPAGWQVQNMLSVAKLITFSARMRTESRGAHHRSDFPDRDDLNWSRHLIIKRA